MAHLSPSVVRACVAELQKLAQEPQPSSSPGRRRVERLRALLQRLLRRSLTGKALHVAGVDKILR